MLSAATLCPYTNRSGKRSVFEAPGNTQPSSHSVTSLSIIIAVYNDWIPLEQCLESLAVQRSAPAFEVIVVDDGSYTQAPARLLEHLTAYRSRIVRQPHSGISVARNSGIQVATSPLLLFVDADSRLQADCLRQLVSTVEAHSEHNCFQLQLIGNRSTLIGKSEELRLITLQDHLRVNACIRYVNTAGFAIRSASIEPGKDLFNPTVLRGEDTLLLLDLLESGELPLYALAAVVQHATPLTIFRCLQKDIRSAYREGKAYKIAAARELRIRVTHRERLTMLKAMWKTSAQPSIGRTAWFVLTLRQALQRVISLANKILHRDLDERQIARTSDRESATLL